MFCGHKQACAQVANAVRCFQGGLLTRQSHGLGAKPSGWAAPGAAMCPERACPCVPEQARLVDGLCAPGGLRAQPAREDLRLFVESIGNLDGARVAQLLQAKMVCCFGSSGIFGDSFKG